MDPYEVVGNSLAFDEEAREQEEEREERRSYRIACGESSETDRSP